MGDKLSRREFLEKTARMGACACAAAGCAGVADLVWPIPASAQRRTGKGEGPKLGYIAKTEALYYEKLDQKRVKCKLCPRECVVGDKERGYCGARENMGGVYRTFVYGNPCTINVDPLEKKPILHAYPKSKALSIATAGCNLNCKYCQNWQMSQSRPEDTRNYQLTPKKLVDTAKEAGHTFIAFDYTEPVVFFEYVLESARLAKKAGLRTAMCTAAYIKPEPLVELAPYLDVLKVDLKGDKEFYKDVVEGKADPVYTAAKVAKREGVWVELVNLVIPTFNDKEPDFTAVAKWVKENMGADTPLTFSRFMPMYQLKNLPPTTTQTVEKARSVAMKAGLHYVYLGNVSAASSGRNTYCPKCGETVVQRLIYDVKKISIENGKCKKCSYKIAGRWS